MRLLFLLLRPLTACLMHMAIRRPPDVVIGGADVPYLRRWYITPWSAWWRDGPRTVWQRGVLAVLPNIYLHQILRSDDDRALHDHPWINLSLILSGGYIEHTIAAGGIHHRHTRRPGDVKLRGPRAAHRLEITDQPCWTLFLTGPVWRQWGFHCPNGWRSWREFVDDRDHGRIGRGCA